MKSKKALFWTVARVVLAVGLLTFVFTSVIAFKDKVTFPEGAVVSGRIVTWTSGEVVLCDFSASAPLDGIDAAEEISGEDGPAVRIDLAAYGDRVEGITVERGLFFILKEVEPTPYLVGLLALGVIPFLATVRWRLLMHAQEIKIGFWRTLELTYVGLFFNNVSLGLTGGDVVKAYYATKLTSTKKTNAVVTVFLDRLIGIVLLGAVAGAAVVLGLVFPVKEQGEAFVTATWIVVGFIFASLIGGMAFFSRRIRRIAAAVAVVMPGWERFASSRIGNRGLDMLKRIDSAVILYRSRKMVLLYAAALSVVAHSSAIFGVFCFGRALGITGVGLTSFFVIVPICFILSSIPLTPAGWGVGEMLFQTFFGAVGVAATTAVTMSVVYRLTQALWTLPGGVMLMFQKERPTIEQVEAEMEGVESDSESALEGN
jgi:hypothetical protein